MGSGEMEVMAWGEWERGNRGMKNGPMGVCSQGFWMGKRDARMWARSK